jgi:parallel beta-helix repeat protein
MKRAIRLHGLLIVTALGINAGAATYYVAANGDDSRTAAQAQDPSTPWQGLAKVNSLTLAAGDQVLFRRGDTFRGTLNIGSSGQSGNPIAISAYGTGTDAPRIAGTEVITGWSVHQGDIYVADVTQHVYQVFLDDNPVGIARHPDTGYFTIDDAPTVTSLVSSDLDAGTDWTGAVAHVRTSHWTIASKTVTSHTGTTLELESEPVYGINPGWGFFLNSHLGALDAPGEWCYDAASRKLYLWTPAGDSPANYTVEASVYENGVDLAGGTYITVSDLQIFGHYGYGIDASGSNLVIENNTVLWPDARCLNLSGGSNNLVRGNTFKGANHFNVYLGSSNSELSGNTISHTALMRRLNASGMDDNCCNGLGVQVQGTDNLVASNRIDSTGYIGIRFNGERATIEHNHITWSCLTKDDGAAIYTWNDDFANPGAAGSVVRGNTVLYSVGAAGGTGGSSRPAEGIYIDDRSHDIDVLDNTVAHMANYGIYLHNTMNVSVRGNVVYNSGSAQLRLTEDFRGGAATMSGNTIKENVFYCLSEDQLCLLQSSEFGETGWGVSDSNYLCNPYSQMLVKENNVVYSFGSWQTDQGHDINSTPSLVYWTSAYAVSGTTGNEMINNGTFETDIGGWGRWPSACTITHETNAGLDAGSLGLTYTDDTEASKCLVYPTTSFEIVQSEMYELCYSARAQVNTTLDILVRMAHAPWSTVGLSRSLALTPERQDFSIVFEGSESDPEVRTDFSVALTATPVYIDNVSLFAVEVEYQDPQEKSVLFSNTTGQTQSIDLQRQGYLDLDGNSVQGSLTLDPFHSIVLVADSSTAVTSRPTGRAGAHRMVTVRTTPEGTRVCFVNAQRRLVTVSVSDAAGRTVRVLTTRGSSVVWDHSDRSASRVAPGVYLIRAGANGPACANSIVLAD